MLTSAVVISVHALQKKWNSICSIEVGYLALFGFVLIFVLNGNQWASGAIVFPILAIIAIFSIIISFKKLNEFEFKEAFQDGICLVILQVLALVAVFVLFRMCRYWLLEGPNHDSLIYYEGLHWAMVSPLFVGKEAVQSAWGLGVCTEHGPWIGYDCPLYRGGTYTLAAWVQFFAPRVNGNAIYFIAAYSVSVAWFACRLLLPRVVSRWAVALLALLVGFSTGIIGALVNGNLATLLAATCFVAVLAVALRSDIPPEIRFGLMAIWCAVSTHFYAESIFYTGLFVTLVLLIELHRYLHILRLKGVIRLIGFVVIIIFGLGNIAVLQAFTSIFVIGDIAKGGEWFSWYIHQPPFFWIGSFVAGLLVGSENPVFMVVAAAVVITLFAVINLLKFQRSRAATIALICTSCLLVFYIETTAYQYGEHKIIQMLGPAWTLAVVFANVKLLDWISDVRYENTFSVMTKIAGWGGLFSLALISIFFLYSARSLLNSFRLSHSIDFGLPIVTSYVRPGSTVLVDDTAWPGVEKFQKAHYAAFQFHNQRVEVLFPNITSDSLRGGYAHENRANTLSGAKSVDWFLQSKGKSVSNSIFALPNVNPVWENANFRLFKVENRPVAVSGNGWYDCESTQCWTQKHFEIETYIPQSGHFELSMNFSAFSSPEAGVITVQSFDGKVLAKVKSSNESLRVRLPNGWSRLIFDGDWPINSPSDMGLSADQRKLFVAVKRVTISPLREQVE